MGFEFVNQKGRHHRRGSPTALQVLCQSFAATSISGPNTPSLRHALNRGSKYGKEKGVPEKRGPEKRGQSNDS